MAISRTGNFFEDAANGYLSIGETAVGGLTVNGGSVLILDDTNNSDDPYLAFGRQGGGNGTGLITGAGSEIRLVGSGIADLGATVHVGRFGTGSLNVENGGALTIVDTSNTENVFIGITVARASGSGTFTVDNGSVDLTGPGAYFYVGREGGNGTATIRNGSDFNMTGTAAGHYSSIQVGRDGGTGALIVDDSTMTLTATNGGFNIGIGAGGSSASTGTLTVRNGGSIVTDADGGGIRVGNYVGSSGELQILSGGSVTVTDTGVNEFGGGVFVGEFAGITKAEVLVDGSGSLLDGNDVVMIGSNAYSGATVAGNGVVTVRNGGTLTAQDIVVGLGGRLVAHGATLNVDNYVGVGGGTLTVKTAGGPLTINGSLSSELDGDIRFEVDPDGAVAGRIVLSGDFYMDDTGTVTIDTLGRYSFSAGQTYTLITGTATGDYFVDEVSADQFNVTGQAADFGFLVGRLGNNVIFRTLTDYDGSGNAILNFGALTSVGASFTYDSSIDGGTGFGGLFGDVAARNVDEIRGTGANDVFIVNGSSPMVMSGVDGDDQLTGGSGNDSIKGGAGADTIDGGLGNDIATYIGSDAGVTVNLATGTGIGGHAQGDTLASIERLTGSALADTLTGNAGANTINGYIGNDTIIGGAGGDTLLGSSGIDTVSYVGSNAAVTVDIQANTASGGHATGDTISGFENITGSSFGDSLTGNSLANVLTGGQGDDTLVGAGGADTLNGGAGNDTAVYSASTAGVIIDLQAGTASGGHAAGDTFTSVENLVGSDFDDTLTGNSLANNLSGGIGNDTLSGGAGDDTLTGGNGNDTLRGWTGFDFLDGGSGDDIIYGDADNDTLMGGSGNDTLNGGAANDTLNGGAGNDTLIGGTGGDNLAGSTGDDTLIGGTGIDNFTFLVNYDNDSISGFEDNVDRIRLDDALWGGGLTAAEVLANYAVQTTPGIVTFDFGNGDTLRVINGAGISIGALENDIVII